MFFYYLIVVIECCFGFGECWFWAFKIRLVLLILYLDNKTSWFKQIVHKTQCTVDSISIIFTTSTVFSKCFQGE